MIIIKKVEIVVELTYLSTQYAPAISRSNWFLMISCVAGSDPNCSVSRMTNLPYSFCRMVLKFDFKELMSCFLRSPATVVAGLATGECAANLLLKISVSILYGLAIFLCKLSVWLFYQTVYLLFKTWPLYGEKKDFCWSSVILKSTLFLRLPFKGADITFADCILFWVLGVLEFYDNVFWLRLALSSLIIFFL